MALRRKPPLTVTPQSLLDAAYDERLQSLERIRAAADAVHASRARLEASRRSWTAAVERHERDAATALTAGDEATARSAAARCVPIDADISAADDRLAGFRDTAQQLALAHDIVAQQLNALRRRRDATRGTATTQAALEAVRADIAALADGFGEVQRALEQPR